MIQQFYLTHREDPNIYYYSELVDVEVMAMKKYPTFPKAPGQEPR